MMKSAISLFEEDAKYIALTVGTGDDPAWDTVMRFADVLHGNWPMAGLYGQLTLGDTLPVRDLSSGRCIRH